LHKETLELGPVDIHLQVSLLQIEIWFIAVRPHQRISMGFRGQGFVDKVSWGFVDRVSWTRAPSKLKTSNARSYPLGR
jgi:hypothetical protein